MESPVAVLIDDDESDSGKMDGLSVDFGEDFEGFGKLNAGKEMAKESIWPTERVLVLLATAEEPSTRVAGLSRVGQRAVEDEVISGRRLVALDRLCRIERGRLRTALFPEASPTLGTSIGSAGWVKMVGGTYISRADVVGRCVSPGEFGFGSS